MFIAFYTLVTLAIASFTNVLIHRAPKNLSFISPGSSCPQCGYKIPWLEKIPVLSYLLLQGKCKNCKTKISILYPAIELALPLLCFQFIKKAATSSELILKLNFSLQENLLAQLLNFLDFFFPVIMIAITIALAVIDHKQHILPHSLTYLGIVLGVFFISIFGTEFYESPEIFSQILGGYFAGFLSCLMQLGIVFFSLDFLTHFANKLYYKDKALTIDSSALSFGTKFLQEKISLVYLLIATLVLVLLLNFQDFVLHYLFVILGASYFINEIILDYFFAKAQTTPDSSDKKTVLGGGDVAMIAMIAVVLGLAKTALAVLSAFYLAFVYLLFKFILVFFETAFSKETEGKPDGMQLLKDNLARHIPLGGALAVSFIAAMMFFS